MTTTVGRTQLKNFLAFNFTHCTCGNCVLSSWPAPQIQPIQITD